MPITTSTITFVRDAEYRRVFQGTLSDAQVVAIATGAEAAPEGVEGRGAVETFAGCVIAEPHWQCVQVMSDMYENFLECPVWDAEAGRVRTVTVGGYCFGDGDSRKVCTVKVDATPETLAAVAAYKAAVQAAADARAAEERAARAERDARTVERGKVVKVVRGRKVPIGTTGKVFWTGIDRYNNRKVGIALSELRDERGRNVDVAWTAASNCEVVLGE